MHIFITGYMGVGKTTVGQKLSELLQVPFIDLDAFIEQNTSSSIPQLFKTKGEQQFRKLERDALLTLCNKKENHLIALGGGTMCHLNNHLDILQNGIAVYLYKPWSEIARNLNQLQNRPLIQKNNMTELEAIFRKRQPFYELSQLKMPTNSTFNTEKLADTLKILTNR
ncbi:shikimate kinase [Bacteroidia bacterium]|nr:shikimate kinase [Bacteroidia bacterium]